MVDISKRVHELMEKDDGTINYNIGSLGSEELDEMAGKYLVARRNLDSLKSTEVFALDEDKSGNGVFYQSPNTLSWKSETGGFDQSHAGPFDLQKAYSAYKGHDIEMKAALGHATWALEFWYNSNK